MRVDASGGNSSYVAKAQVESTVTVDKSEIKTQIKTEETTIDIAPARGEREQVQEQEVIQAIEKANKHFKSFDRRLEFSIHDKTKQIMVKVINTEDDSIVREIPSEKILDMVAKLWEMAGIFVDEKR